MKHLSKENFNSAEVYDSIFKEREKKGVNWFDNKRWRTLLKYYKGGDLLDIGCLDSKIPEMIKEEDYWGTDVSKTAVEEMQARYPKAMIFLNDIYEGVSSGEFFDYVVMGEVLEHLEKPELAIQEAMSALKTEGTLAISVPYKETKLGEVDGHLHLWSFDETDIMNLLKSYGGVKFKIIGSQWLPRYKYAFPSIIGYCKKK